MTFGALATWQAWLLLAAAAGFATWLFQLKVRPPRVVLPSLLLWRRVLDEAREITLWERIRRAVSLAATIVIALALALAVVRPSPRVRGAAATRGRTLIVLDTSWSMLTRTGSGETRWRRAISEARRIAAASADDVSVATTSDGTIEGPTSDVALIESALDGLAPGGGDRAWWPAAAPAQAVHFITDGAVARRIDRGVTVHSVFEPAGNVAITAFDVRPALAGGHAGEAYLEVANYAASAQAVHLTIARGQSRVLDRRFDMRAGESLRQVMPLPRGGDPALRAHVDAATNALGIDDEAVAWIEHARPLSVAVVGQHTAWLAALLARDPDVRATFLDHGLTRKDTDRETETGGEDVVIFDRSTPAAPPNRPALYFAPPMAVTSDELRPLWTAAGAHPVVRGVDPFTLTIDKARRYTLPGLAVVAESARRTPLVYAGEMDAHRTVVVTFGPGESNLASAPAFPVLVGNALDWLGRTSGAAARRPGSMTFDESIVRVTDPRGTAVPLTRVNHVAVGVLRSPGLYVADGSAARTAIAVNAGDPQLSNVMRTTLGAQDRSRPVAGRSNRPWWISCALAAFALALAEWWTWQRRITV